MYKTGLKIKIISDRIKVIVQFEFQNVQMVATRLQYSNQQIIFKYVKINQILLSVLIVGNADFIRINIFLIYNLASSNGISLWYRYH